MKKMHAAAIGVGAVGTSLFILLLGRLRARYGNMLRISQTSTGTIQLSNFYTNDILYSDVDFGKVATVGLSKSPLTQVDAGQYVGQTRIQATLPGAALKGETESSVILDYTTSNSDTVFDFNSQPYTSLSDLTIKCNASIATQNAIFVPVSSYYFDIENLTVINAYPNAVLQYTGLNAPVNEGLSYGKINHCFLQGRGGAKAGKGVGLNFYSSGSSFINGNNYNDIHILGYEWAVGFQDTGNIAANNLSAINIEDGTTAIRALDSSWTENVIQFHVDSGSVLSSVVITASGGNNRLVTDNNATLMSYSGVGRDILDTGGITPLVI